MYNQLRKMSRTSDNLEPEKRNLNPIATGSQSTPPVLKLRKIPTIPVRHRVFEDDANEDHESASEKSLSNEASILGLNHIRTRSSPSPLGSCNSFVSPFDVQHSSEQGGFCVPL